MIFLLLYTIAWAVLAFASTVSVLTPLDSQLPPIARVDTPFSWTFSSSTFTYPNGGLKYTTSLLPGWLSFDDQSLTFSGTPSNSDVGHPEITVTAKAASSSASSAFAMCITTFPAPTLNLPIAEQFYTSNPSLSSVFLLTPNSALAAGNPTLRVPPSWSFSVGFEWNTFNSTNSLFYAGLRADGTDLPDWMEFNPDTITFNGVSPHEDSISAPETIALALHASDQEGYTASALPFTLVVAEHEVSLSTLALPTINVTSSTPFNITLSSPADFSGVLVDSEPIQPSEIATLSIDTSSYSWLKYQNATRMLSGDAQTSAGQEPKLPVVLVTTFNQTIRTNVSLAIVPSYFSASNLDSITVPEDGEFHFNLVQYFSNATTEQRGNVNLTAAFDPGNAANYLTFDPGTAQLVGTVPANFSSSSSNTHITVTFTAYSHITHSTSHASLPISAQAPSNDKDKKGITHPQNLSKAAHAKLALGLGISFGVVVGLCFVGVLLAAFRRCVRVDDTALGGEQGRVALSEKDRKWYKSGGAGSNWSLTASITGKFRQIVQRASFDPIPVTGDGTSRPVHPGLGLHRVSERSQSDSPLHGSPAERPRIPGVLSKAEFFGRIKETVRKVSDKYSRRRRGSSSRPVIGKPILITSSKVPVEGLPFDGQMIPGSSVNPFDDPNLSSYPGSTILDSPSGSTAERSIPRRRADFAPPKSPALVHFEDGWHARKQSTDSTNSLASDAADAVVQTASRATSIRSVRSPSGVSYHSIISEPTPATGLQPRLVPFTSATRVPVPRLSPGEVDPASPVTTKRVASQNAKVFSQRRASKEVKKSVSGDELTMGMHYVRALGADQRTVGTNPSTPTISTNVRSSFSSLESSHQGHHAHDDDVLRMLVRAGERFKFRVPVVFNPANLAEPPKLEARLISGDPLPKFLFADLTSGSKHKGGVEFSGVPTADDLGELMVGVYTCDDGVRVGRAFVEVVGRS